MTTDEDLEYEKDRRRIAEDHVDILNAALERERQEYSELRRAVLCSGVQNLIDLLPEL